VKKIKQLGLYFLFIVLFIEIGYMIGNILEGYSPFRFFGDVDRFGVDNNLFILYWGSLVGVFSLIEGLLNKKKFKEILEESLDIFSSKKKEQEVEIKEKIETEEKEMDSSYGGEWNVEWEEGPGIYFWSKNKIDKDLFEVFMNEKNITYRDLYNKKEVLIKEYGYWVEKKGYKQKI